MNMVLLEPGQIAGGGAVALDARQSAHVAGVLRSSPGDSIRVGELGGMVGRAEVLEVSSSGVILAHPELDREPPRPWFDLMLAMPRPKVMRRLWAPLASLGARHIILTNAAKVEGDYFGNHWLDPAAYVPLLKEGLEQSGATALPQVEIVKRLRPFVEDVVPIRFANATKLLAHPDEEGKGGDDRNDRSDRSDRNDKSDGEDGNCGNVKCRGEALPLLAVGPEGGWTPFELDMLERSGFRRFSLGSRPLRTDVAIAALCGAMMAV